MAAQATDSAPTPGSLSITKQFRPYYSPAELVVLIHLQAYAKADAKQFSDNRIEAWRQLACGFVERVGSRLGFPRRTIATAQTLYHRFHLHFPLKDFHYPDVSIAAILVSSKLEDTLKKLREIQVAAWQILNLLDGGPGTGEGDIVTQENHRPHLIAIERLILQTICFNFNLHRSPLVLAPSVGDGGLPDDLEVGANPRDVFAWVIRLGAALGASKPYTYLAHLLAIDVHRTLAPLSYPPHTVASACLWLASFLSTTHSNSFGWRGEPVPAAEEGDDEVVFEEGWCEQFESHEEDIEEIAHLLLNLLIQLCPPTPSASFALPSPTFSPLSLLSPADPSRGVANEKEKHLLQTGIPHVLSGIIRLSARTVEDFTRVKIRLREVVGSGRKRGREEEAGVAEDAKRWRGSEVMEEREEGKAASVRYRF